MIIAHKTILRLFICKVGGINLSEYRTFSDLSLGSISMMEYQSKLQLLEYNITKHLEEHYG